MDIVTLRNRFFEYLWYHSAHCWRDEKRDYSIDERLDGLIFSVLGLLTGECGEFTHKEIVALIGDDRLQREWSKWISPAGHSEEKHT